MFMQGGFRVAQWRRVQDQDYDYQLKLVSAKLVKTVDPAYPPEAAAQRITGTVCGYFVIGADCVVYNAHAISGQGLSNDPDLRKAGEQAVNDIVFTQ